MWDFLKFRFQIYTDPNSSEEVKEKAKTALKMFLFKIEDLGCVEPLLTTAPPCILKYVVAQYSKVSLIYDSYHFFTQITFQDLN